MGLDVNVMTAATGAAISRSKSIKNEACHDSAIINCPSQMHSSVADLMHQCDFLLIVKPGMYHSLIRTCTRRSIWKTHDILPHQMCRILLPFCISSRWCKCELICNIIYSLLKPLLLHNHSADAWTSSAQVQPVHSERTRASRADDDENAQRRCTWSCSDVTSSAAILRALRMSSSCLHIANWDDQLSLRERQCRNICVTCSDGFRVVCSIAEFPRNHTALQCASRQLHANECMIICKSLNTDADAVRQSENI